MMGRLDWKRGRFDSDFETGEIHRGLRGHQASQVGDEVEYYRFDFAHSQMDDLYDEAAGLGKIYHPPVMLPCLHVTHDEGENQDTDTGFYFNDNIYITAAFDQVYRTGLTLMDIEHHRFLKDRLVYDGRVFRVTQIHILGQVQTRDIVVSIEGTQVKPDEMVNDPQFGLYSTGLDIPLPPGTGIPQQTLTDPHPQYALDTDVDAKVAEHEAEADPHPQYTTQSDLVGLRDEILGGAGPAYDTLQELKALLDTADADADSAIAAINTALGYRVRADINNQGFTSIQQANARINIDVYSKAEIGDITTDFVTTFENGLL